MQGTFSGSLRIGRGAADKQGALPRLGKCSRQMIGVHVVSPAVLSVLGLPDHGRCSYANFIPQRQLRRRSRRRAQCPVPECACTA